MIRKLGLTLAVLIFGAVAAIATISSSLNSITVAGTGAQTVFSFPFVGVAASDISVIYTDSSGNETTLVQGPGTTQYQVSLNGAVPPALWGVGGTITYNPSGTPIASGTTLTIVRTLPYLQLTSLQNQASFGQLAQATEMALDQLEMQIQQISNSFGRALQGPVNDPTGLSYTLPPAAQRANTGIAFDSQGNVIAGVVPSTGIISTPMQPVVSAASLAAARAALGLGSAATGAVNYGLQQGVSGAGLIDVNSTPVQDSTNQSVTAAFHLTRRICTGPITYTLPQADTTWAGFGFWVYAASGTCTITPNAADNFLGLASGTGIAVPAGSWVFITTSAASTGVWWADYHGPANASLVAGVGASALTLTLYSGPLQFRDTTLANGDPVWSLPANGVSITVPSTATLGTSNSTPFRIWIYAAYNSGTPILGVAICSISTQTYPCASWEVQRKTGTLISTGATSPGTLYTSASTSNDSVVIIGYADYASGLSTAGTWASAPTTLQLCLPPRQCLKPGATVQRIYAATANNDSSSSTSFVASNATLSITPTSAINLIYYLATGYFGQTTATDGAIVQMTRGTTPQIGQPQFLTSAANSIQGPYALPGFDAPGVATSTAYTVYYKAVTGGSVNVTKGIIILEEIMGALDRPASDNGLTQISKVA